MPSAQHFEIVLPSSDLAADLTFFGERLAFRLEQIFPADDPEIAVLSGHGIRLRLVRDPDAAPAVLRLACAEAGAWSRSERELQAPGGARIQLVESWPLVEPSRTRHALVVSRADHGNTWHIFFTFVLSGSLTFQAEGAEPRRLSTADAFVIPPGLKTRIGNWTEDVTLLEVALPATVTPAKAGMTAAGVYGSR